MTVAVRGGRACDALDRVRALHASGLAANHAGRPAEARRVLRSALTALEAPAAGGDADAVDLCARVLLTLASSVSELEGLPSALAVLDEADQAAVAGGHQQTVALVAAQRGGILCRLGRGTDAVRELRRALTLGVDLDARDRANLLLSRSYAWTLVGDLQRGRRDARAAAELAEQAGLTLERAKALHNVGYLTFLIGDLPEALRLMEVAGTLVPDLPSGVLLLDRARVLTEAGLLREADEALQEAGRVSMAARRWQDVGEIDLSRAQCALFRGEPELARRLALRARDRLRRRGTERWSRQADLVMLGADLLGGRRTRSMTASADRLAESLTGDGDVAAARMAALIGAELRLHGGDVAAADDAVRTARPRPSDPIAVRMHAGYVRALVALHGGDIATARRAIRAGLGDLDQHRAKFGSIDLRTAAAVHGQRLAQLDLSLALASGRASEVVSAAERGRAVATRLPVAHPPADEQAAGLLSQLRQVVEQAGALGLPAGQATELAESRRELERRISGLAWTRAGAGAVSRPTGLSELRALAAARDAVVVYYVASEGMLHAVRTGAVGTRIVRLGPTRPVRELARRVRADLDVLAGGSVPAVLRGAASSSLARSLAALDAALLAPLTRPDRRVVVIPTGSLAVLPWNLLPGLRGTGVEVAPSATAWRRAVTGGRAEGGSGTGAGTGSVTRTGVWAVSGPGLHRADQEVTDVARRWPGARAVSRDRATCPVLTEALSGSAIVHIAAHGRHSMGNPLFSSLRLADGPVFAHELEAVDEMAEHVVLSACELGVATIRPGDEPLGLTSVLLHRGTRSVVAGVAAVADDVAHEVMVRYHDRLAAGIDSALALSDAVCELPADRPAPFVCFGSAWQVAPL